MKSLKASGVPIHGIGFQVHLGWDETFDQSELEKTFKKFADLGLEIHITESNPEVHGRTATVNRSTVNRLRCPSFQSPKS